MAIPIILGKRKHVHKSYEITHFIQLSIVLLHIIVTINLQCFNNIIGVSGTHSEASFRGAGGRRPPRKKKKRKKKKEKKKKEKKKRKKEKKKEGNYE